MTELYDSPESPRMTRAVQWLLGLNIGVYFLQLTLFGQDAVYSALALDPARFPGNWWTVATYMFVHAWLAHLALTCSRCGCSAHDSSRSGGRAALFSSTYGVDWVAPLLIC